METDEHIDWQYVINTISSFLTYLSDLFFILILIQDVYKRQHQDIHLYVQLENIDSEYGSHLRDCYISLKIGKGRKRMYIVKRIQEFLEAIAHEEYISYGKELALSLIHISLQVMCRMIY